MTNEQILSLMVIFGVALGLSLLLTVLARWLGPKVGIVDKPRDRHKHPHPVSKFGGLAMYGAFTIAALLAQVMPVERADPNEMIRFVGLILGGTAAFLFGAFDDLRNLRALPQYIAQIFIAAIAIIFLIFIEKFNNPLTGQPTPAWPYIITVTLSLFWMGLMMNTVNWLDGSDGLAGGVVFIGAGLLFLHTVRADPFTGERQLSVSLLALALMGAALGFLLFNWHPASIFMGSNGALFLGYTLGALSIIGGAKMATILLVMGLPLLDVAWQIVRRVRQGQNPGVGDRGHVHFRLVDAGVSPRLIASVYYLFCATFGVLALITTSRQFKLLAMAVMFGLVIVGFGLVARLRPLVEDVIIDKPDVPWPEDQG